MLKWTEIIVTESTLHNALNPISLQSNGSFFMLQQKSHVPAYYFQ